jgi:hypothetical protein
MSLEGWYSGVVTIVEAIVEESGRVEWRSVVGGSYMNGD